MKISAGKSLLTLFLALTAFQLTAQQRGQERKITGRVMVAETQEGMIGANVLIRTLADSILVSTVTGLNGEFEIVRPNIPSVILEVSFLGYQKIRRTHNRGDGLNVGDLGLVEDSKLLGEVLIEGQVPVGEMKGDTTSFNANAFKTQENAVAEDLIRKIPGVTFQNGEIQAQGEQVQKVLVDGREFFGSDPTLALRNLPADAIDRVEILDQRSDQSRLTGFDDGNYAKTINIILRDDKRNGQFGRLYAGYGTQDTYSAGGNLNFFKGDRRISVIGLFNNINQQNFSSQDLIGVEAAGGGGRGGFGGGGGRPGGGRPGGGGNNNFLVGQDLGIITTNSLGLNYSDRWGKKINFTGSYFFNNTINSVRQLTNRETIIGEDLRQFYLENQISAVENNNHRINGRVEYDINDKNSLIITPNINFQNNSRFNDTDALNLGSNLDSLSALRSISDASTGAYNVANNLLYTYRFDKKGRTITTNLFTALNQRDQFTDLLAANRDFVRNASDTLIQETNALSDGFNYRANITYTEPLGENAIGTLNYQIGNNKTSADQKTFQLAAEQGIMVLDTALSNEFDNKFITQRIGTGYRLNKNNWNVNLNLDYQHAVLDSRIIFPTEGDFNRKFNNLLPTANVSYRNRETGTSYRFRYRTSTNEPSVLQLQNVINNNNPLNLTVGNPDLGQSFNHTVFANVAKVNLEKSKTFFMFLFASLTEDFIGNSTFVALQDTVLNGNIFLPTGGQLSRPVNLSGNFRSRLFMTYGAPVTKIKSQFNMNSSISFNRAPGLINGEKNLNDNIDLSQGFTLSSNISKDVDFSISTTGVYTIVNSSLQSNLDNNFYIQTSSLRLYYSPNNGKTFIGNNVNHSLYRGLSEGLDQSVWLWNVEAGYRFLKNNKGELKMTVFDILNQNNSISRTVSDVAVTDVFTNVLTRYAMVSFTYILGNFKKAEEPESPWQRMRPAGGRSW